MRSQSAPVTHINNGDHRNGDPPAQAAELAKRRSRVLLFACSQMDAQFALRLGSSIEIAFLPSYDIEEILAEITQFRPRLIACHTDFFLAALSSSLSSGTPQADSSRDAIARVKPVPPSVTPRQAKVLAMLIRGKTNSEMAQTLNLSVRTIKRELNGLFERFGASNRTELSNRTAQLSVLKPWL